MFETFFAILPVFLLVLVGFASAKTGWLPDGAGHVLNQYAVRIAVPALLFAAMVRLDFSQAFAPPVLLAFYAGALACFVLGFAISRLVFSGSPERAVAVGFAATFSNTVLLGLPITDRVYGDAELTVAYGIVSIHALTVYTVGMTAMEFAHPDNGDKRHRIAAGLRRIVGNPLLAGVAAGIVANLAGLPLPQPIMMAIDMLAASAIPAALIGIGVSLSTLRIRSELSETLIVCGLLLIVHPALAWTMGRFGLGLGETQIRGATLLAAMPAGVNAYLFALLYDRGVRLSASVVMVSTMLSIFTITGWIAFLG
ncbi:AEC family transporter [Notoacmeibacter marinus]|uniref:AEC family transporter n=1 Tax=Notoacmeibacter marinus TaxID=1876515 RepID=UPI00130374F4|nr:AEC family transporter [Notoacmeibacter marinus]